MPQSAHLHSAFQQPHQMDVPWHPVLGFVRGQKLSRELR
jgi:hypothetical protein